MNAVIYTSSCGQYADKFQRTDILCFKGEGIFNNPVMEAKIYKILPHLFLPGFDYWIWIDANIKLKVSIEEAITKFLRDSDMAIFKHPSRGGAYQEAKEILHQANNWPSSRFNNPYLKSKIAQQYDFYESVGFPSGFGLWECNFIIRRNTPEVNQLMNAWWAYICRWQWRDQISFPYILWKYGQNVKMRTIKEGDIRKHPDFEYTIH